MPVRFLFLLLFSCLGVGLSAQSPLVRSLERSVPGQGTVVIEQDDRLDAWLRQGKVVATPSSASSNAGKKTTSAASATHSGSTSAGHSAASSGKAQADSLTASSRVHKAQTGRPVRRSGFRVQVYSGPATRDSKNRANAAAAKVRELFPHLSAYPIFVSPRWLCVVGDFLTREEAVEARRKLRESGAFTECSIVRSQVLVFL